MINWKKVVRGIAIGYLHGNYSKQFVKNSKIDKVTKRKDSKVIYRAYYWNGSNGEFMIQINTRRKTIEHYGCYSKNRGIDAEKLINFNIDKWSENLIS